MIQSPVLLELLAPARDLHTGITAVNSGADAVYIGGPGFGARAAAGNSIADIATLVRYAHPFRVKVYATVNTLLTDEQMPQAVELINRLYEAGVDAVIIQDAGLLQQKLPPVPLHASTQFHNFTPEKVKFLESAGISRVILARELTLAEIEAIRKITAVELEFFIHGALCVSLSGQCYLSHALTGRSANRGECSQPCRSYYSLFDSNGRQLARDKHLLSLKDLNLSAHIGQLAEAGITSFKIEGRLKDENYVRNITAHYSLLLNRFIEANPGYRRASEGVADPGFNPDPDRSFNRGFTTYFIDGRQPGIYSPDGAKALGKPIGSVRQVYRDHFVADLTDPVANGDGLSFFDAAGQQRGLRINRADGNKLYPLSPEGLNVGTKLFRNRDQAFENRLHQTPAVRRLPAKAVLEETGNGISLTFTSIENTQVTVSQPIEKITPAETGNFMAFITGQVTKSGNTIFSITEVAINCRPLLIKTSVLNALRRDGLNALAEALLANYRRALRKEPGIPLPFPEPVLDFRGNVLNHFAREFYESHGVKIKEEGLENINIAAGKPLMTTRHCLRYSYNACLKLAGNRENNIDGSWWLTGNRQVFRLRFDCRRCLMEVIMPSGEEIVPLQVKSSAK